MKKIIVIILLSVIVVSCNNLDKQSKASFDPEQEKENIALVLEKYVIANERQEIELVKEIWAPDTDIVVIGSNSDENLIGWYQIKDALQRQFNTFEETYISVRDQVI